MTPETWPASGQYITQNLKITISVLCYGQEKILIIRTKHVWIMCEIWNSYNT